MVVNDTKRDTRWVLYVVGNTYGWEIYHLGWDIWCKRGSGEKGPGLSGPENSSGSDS